VEDAGDGAASEEADGDPRPMAPRTPVTSSIFVSNIGASFTW
jgi:hypothetical protein